jgi:hypothetical protein
MKNIYKYEKYIYKLISNSILDKQIGIYIIIDFIMLSLFKEYSDWYLYIYYYTYYLFLFIFIELKWNCKSPTSRLSSFLPVFDKLPLGTFNIGIVSQKGQKSG